MNAKGALIMDILFSDYKLAWRPLRLRQRQAVSIEAQRGTQIRSLRGELWITQEGDPHDYFVPAGMFFCADRTGRIVVSALDHAAYASVSWNKREHAGTFSRKTVRIDYARLEELERDAKKARSRELARLTRIGFNWIRHVWRRLASAIPSVRGSAMDPRTAPAGPPGRDRSRATAQTGAVRPCGATPVRQHA